VILLIRATRPKGEKVKAITNIEQNREITKIYLIKKKKKTEIEL